jgi:hypothetical protein
VRLQRGTCSWSQPSISFSRTLGDAHLGAVVLDLETDAGRLAVFRIAQRDVRQVDRRFLADDASFLRLGLRW